MTYLAVISPCYIRYLLSWLFKTHTHTHRLEVLSFTLGLVTNLLHGSISIFPLSHQPLISRWGFILQWFNTAVQLIIALPEEIFQLPAPPEGVLTCEIRRDWIYRIITHPFTFLQPHTYEYTTYQNHIKQQVKVQRFLFLFRPLLEAWIRGERFSRDMPFFMVLCL